jgi:hypothetical protein
MNNMLLSVCGLGLFLASQVSGAVLVDRDWTPGDGKLLYDPSTGLEWLKLSVTANQSFSDVASSLQSGGQYEGFRFATQDEVIGLWGGAGITYIEREWVQIGEHEAVKNLVDRMGATVMFEPGEFPVATHVVGMIDAGPADFPDERWAMELTYAPDELSTRTSANFYTWNIAAADHHYSSYLVQAVPLPATVWLLGSGLLGLFSYSRLMKRTVVTPFR